MASRWSKLRTSAMHKGGVGLLKTAIYLIIACVSFYGDGVFVWMNIGHYTGPAAVIFQIFLVLGAFCTSASIMCLLFGKASWFTPGAQLWLAYCFTAVEVAVNVLNIVVALNPNLGIIDLWRILSPATPFVALIGWIVILQVDKAQLERHKQMEMDEEKAESEREYTMMVHEANMDLKHGYLEQTKQRLQAALNSPAAQSVIEQHAQNLTAQVLNEITGLPVTLQGQVQVTPLSPPPTQPAPQLPAPDVMAQLLQLLQGSTPVREVTGKVEAVQGGATDDPLAGRVAVTMSQVGAVEPPSSNGKHPTT